MANSHGSGEGVLPAGQLTGAAAPHVHEHHDPNLQHHFYDMDQQLEASTLGMWVFLVTEIMFFGGLFMAYLMYRWANPSAFQEASAHLNKAWGGANTVILIVSSLTMAMAVRSAQTSAKPKTQVMWLVLTMIFGTAFLGVKYIEYADKFGHHLVPGPNFHFDKPEFQQTAQIYYSLYFSLTGLHATHMIVGMVIMAIIARMAAKGQFTAEWYTPVEVMGLYWHFVDLVWIFLFPLLYLIGGAH